MVLKSIPLLEAEGNGASFNFKLDITDVNKFML